MVRHALAGAADAARGAAAVVGHGRADPGDALLAFGALHAAAAIAPSRAGSDAETAAQDRAGQTAAMPAAVGILRAAEAGAAVAADPARAAELAVDPADPGRVRTVPPGQAERGRADPGQERLQHATSRDAVRKRFRDAIESVAIHVRDSFEASRARRCGASHVSWNPARTRPNVDAGR